MIYAAVGQHIMLAGPLHGSLVQRFNTQDQFQWVAIQLQPYIGQRAIWNSRRTRGPISRL